jgi:hypothetical protein
MASEDKQISLSNPDARSMATIGKGSGMVGYNVQSAVDTTHHLIVAHEVTNVGTDRSQLSMLPSRHGPRWEPRPSMSWPIADITTARADDFERRGGGQRVCIAAYNPHPTATMCGTVVRPRRRRVSVTPLVRSQSASHSPVIDGGKKVC